MEHLAVPPLPRHLLSTVYQRDGCLCSWEHWGSWLGCHVLPAIVAVSILDLAANSGSSRMSQAPNFHLAMQLLIIDINESIRCISSPVSYCPSTFQVSKLH